MEENEEQELLEGWMETLGLITSAFNAQQHITRGIFSHLNSVLTLENGPDDVECDSLAVTYANAFQANQRDESNEIQHLQFSQSIHQKDGLDFFRHLRVTHETYACLLEKVKEKHGEIYGRVNDVIPLEVSLDAFLWYHGHDNSYEELTYLFGLANITMRQHIQKITDILCGMAPDIIKWPSGTEFTELEKEFSQIAGFPGVIGIIDGHQMDLRRPIIFNHKTYLGLTMMAVCDDKKRFTFISSEHYGSWQKHEAFKETKLYHLIEETPDHVFPAPEYHLLGDAGFVPSHHLLIPYVPDGELSEKQDLFNKKLSSTRKIITDAFRLLKARFKSLQYIDAQLKNIPKIITACCVVHNIAMNSPGQETLLQVEGGFTSQEAEEVQLPIKPFTYDLGYLEKIKNITSKL